MLAKEKAPRVGCAEGLKKEDATSNFHNRSETQSTDLSADVAAGLKAALRRVKNGAVDYEASVARIAADGTLKMTLGACWYFVDLWMPNAPQAVVEQHVKKLVKTLGLPDAVPETPSLNSLSGAGGKGVAHQDRGVERADLGLDVEFEIIAFTSRSGRLSKRMLIKDGALIKEPGGWMTEGTAQRIRCSGLADLAKLIPTLKPNQAIALGARSPSRVGPA